MTGPIVECNSCLPFGAGSPVTGMGSLRSGLSRRLLGWAVRNRGACITSAGRSGCVSVSSNDTVQGLKAAGGPAVSI